MSDTALVTADHLLQIRDGGHRYELVAGKLHKARLADWKHGLVGGQLFSLLGAHVVEQGLGRLLDAGTGFLLERDPDTVRAPDIAFIHRDRFPPESDEDAFWPGAPDLAVDVVSLDDKFAELDDKIQAWLDARSTEVWVVNPKWRNVTVYRSATDIQTLTENDDLCGGDVVPGFRCQVGEIFADV